MRLFGLCTLIFLQTLLLSGQTITVSGYISDIETGEILIGAHVYIENTGRGVLSNEYGFYSLTTAIRDELCLGYSYLGYNDTIICCKGNLNIKRNIRLEPGYEIGEVTVKAKRSLQNYNTSGVINLPVKHVKQLPSLAGEYDLMKTLQLMPGVQSGNEGNSGLYVRGGSPDQNLVLLDDVPLYYVNHLGGFISTFNPDALNNVSLIKGGFPSKYGGRLSSILDIRMKDGNQKEFHGCGTIGIVSSKISLEGPIKKDTSSFIISGRRFLYDLFTRPLTRKYLYGYSVGYTFYDLNAKINHKFSDKDRIYFSWYSGDDKSSVIYNEPDVKTDKSKGIIKWGNLLGAFRWNHIYNQKLFSNLSVNYTRFRFSTLTSYQQEINEKRYEYYGNFCSSINDLSAKIDYQYYPYSGQTIEFGAASVLHRFRPAVNTYKQMEQGEIITDTLIGSNNVNAWEHSVYLESKTKIMDFAEITLGARANAYYTSGKSYFRLDPRLSFNVHAAQSTIFYASYSEMMQSVHLLTFSSIGIPIDLWMPATDKVPPSVSSQWTAGISQSFMNEKYIITVDWYKKRMNNLIAYKEGATILGASSNWQNLVETDGIGRSFGVEVLLKKNIGQTTGWLGYTYSRTTRQFANLNGGETYPYKFDRRHDISFVVMHKINSKIDISATWVYGTGNAFTMALAKYDIGTDENSAGKTAFIYGEKNAYRMRPYHRLDVGINFRKDTRWGERIWNISVYNLYNRQNPYFYFIDTERSRDNSGEWTRNTVLKQQSLFPIIPSISYSFKF